MAFTITGINYHDFGKPQELKAEPKPAPGAPKPEPKPAPKASPAVEIDQQNWRPAEMKDVFDVSLDGLTWQACEGDLVGRSGSLDELAARVSRLESGLAKQGEVNRHFDEERIALADRFGRFEVDEIAKSQAYGELGIRIKIMEERLQPVTTAAAETLPAGNKPEAKADKPAAPRQGSRPPN
jgi:hypothetical protein